MNRIVKNYLAILIMVVVPVFIVGLGYLLIIYEKKTLLSVLFALGFSGFFSALQNKDSKLRSFFSWWLSEFELKSLILGILLVLITCIPIFLFFRMLSSAGLVP